MVPKIVWVLLPLSAYGAFLAMAAWRGRLPSRFSLNVQISLLLMAYLLGTASLGIFWVANQQLPVFDWHYLFGYATLLLVSLHLVFNLPAVLRWMKGERSRPSTSAGRPGPRTVGRLFALVTALAIAFFLGTRQGGGDTPNLPHTPRESATAAPAATDAVVLYHEFSSESHGSVFRRAPGVDWGAAPPDFKIYADVPHVVLARRGTPEDMPLGEALRRRAAGTARLSLRELGDMLYLSAGITATRGGIKRASPSSGNLFPSELYVIARAVEGLASGLYHYDPEHARLDLLGPLPVDIGAPQANDADSVVAVAAVFRRTGYKYRDRAYRYVTADAGHLLENLRLAGHRAGMRMQPLARFDESRAAAALGIDGVEEGVLAMMAVRRAATDADGRPQRDDFVASPPATHTALGATGTVHQSTSLRLVPERMPSATDAVVVLPPPMPAADGVYRTIAHRRSQRRFRDEPVPLAALSSMLADMAMPPLLSDAIRINLVVNRVEGLPPGVYRYLPRHALLRVREGRFAEAARSAALEQDVIGDAAVALVLSADREHMLAEGPRGYRHGYLEAGMIGERWLLGAVARGLAACPVGAFYDDEAAALIAVDPKREWVLHFAALGRGAE
jgi:SagB-type dehydrogenase family enzyme